MEILQEMSEMMQRGNAPKVCELVTRALGEGIPAKRILDEGLLSGMGIIGQKFRNNEVFVPEVLVAARAMNKGVATLKPALVADGVKAAGIVVIGTVKGDLHDIGKNLVKLMMEGKGINVVDLGTDVPADRFVSAARENGARVICCSALLTTTMVEFKNVVEAVRSSDISGNVKIMIGGAPVTQQYCDLVGADCYTEDAASAADAAMGIFS